MVSKISQSFMNDIRSYFAGEECGNIIREKWINDRLLEDEEPGSMAQGAYMEYLFTELMLGPGKGSLPKNKKIPQPVFMPSVVKKNGGKTDGLLIADMDSKYRKIHTTVVLMKKYFDEMGIKIIKAGRTLTKGRFVGTIDLECEATKDIDFGEVQWKKGDKFIIDLKYSGLLDDRWSKHGWGWSELQKEYHGTQAKQYSYITNRQPFYFFVVQSNQAEADTPEMKFFLTVVSDEDIEKHLAEGNVLMEKFKNESAFGFVPRPSLNVCSSCPLKDECTDKHTFPHPQIVDLTLNV